MKLELVEAKPGVYVIRVEGEVDMSTSPELRHFMARVFQKGPEHIIVDFAGAPFMDSSGIATMVEGLQLSRKTGARLTLAGLRPQVDAVFELAYLKGVFEIVPDAEPFFP